VECEAAVRQRPFLMSPSCDLSMSAFEPRTDMVNRLSMVNQLSMVNRLSNVRL